MATRNKRLFNVPLPQFYEAASSWLSRMAFSQGVGLQELMEFLDLDWSIDIDRDLHGECLAMVRRICGLPDTALFVHERIMTSLASMAPVGEQYLMQKLPNKSLFRYCPLCLSEMRTPHFPVHWRFVVWRWCPEHDCLLENTCHQCGSALALPLDIANSKSGRQGYTLLNRCQSCGFRLNDAAPCPLQTGDIRHVSGEEQVILANGRALLAALYMGWFQMKGQPERLQLSKFKQLERAGGLPLRLNWLDADKIRQRTSVAG